MAVIVNSNATGETDGSLANMIGRINCHAPLVIVSRCENFVFNEELLGLDKFVIIDASEHSWSFGFQHGTPLFGKNIEYYNGHFAGEGYKKLNQFIKDRKPLLYMKRELLKKDATDFYQSIEYPAWHSAPLVDEAEFNNRVLEVFFSWGLSNPLRPNLHGDIWKQAHNLGYSVCDNLYHLNDFIKEESNPRKWCTVNIPHYARQPIERILEVNGHAKISVSLPGAGRKCFRHAESSLNSVMIFPEDDMAYQHEWISGFNCIKMGRNESFIDAINEAAKRKDLYEIYKNGHATCEKYQVTTYCNHLANIINAL